MPPDKIISTSIYINPNLMARVMAEAEKNHRSRSNQIARLLELALETVEKKEGGKDEN